jgi:hypothetical protein
MHWIGFYSNSCIPTHPQRPTRAQVNIFESFPATPSMKGRIQCDTYPVCDSRYTRFILSFTSVAVLPHSGHLAGEQSLTKCESPWWITSGGSNPRPTTTEAIVLPLGHIPHTQVQYLSHTSAPSRSTRELLGIILFAISLVMCFAKYNICSNMCCTTVALVHTTIFVDRNPIVSTAQIWRIKL